MRRLAISLENEKLSAAHYDAEAGGCAILQFDGKDHLGMHFQMDMGQRLPQLVAKDEAHLHLHAGLDGLKTIGEGVSIEDLLDVVLERVAATVSDVSVVVFLGNESEPAVFRAAAARAGFVDIRFIDRVDAVIRNWQWSTLEETHDAMDVVSLRFHKNGDLTWTRRIAAANGAFLLPGARRTTANGGCFSATADRDIHSGLEVFFDWCEKTGGSRYLVVSGADKTTLPPDIGSALDHHYEVFFSDALIGAASPPYPSRYARFDEAVTGAIAAVDRTDFQTAIANYENAKAIFRTDPPSDLEQLRLQIRQELLKAAAHADLEVDTYFEWAMGFSENLKEKAAVHAEAANFYRKAGDLQRAEDEMLFFYYMDPETYAESHSQETSETTSETPPNGTNESDSVPRVRLGLRTWIWFMYRHLL